MNINPSLESPAEKPPRRKSKILRVIRWVFYLIVVLIGGWFVYALATEKQQPIETGEPHMKAVVYTNYGPPDVLQIRDIKKPVPNDNQVLVRVHTVSINPYDWHFIRGTPYVMRLGVGLRKPKNPRVGVDFAGTIEAVGKNVTQYKPGDEVWGAKTGAFAEYVCVSEKSIALKPANITFEQAASAPIAGLTALQAVRDRAKLQPGQKMLINGASGGVGTFAVQIAKSYGADVTGVCSTRNVDLVRSLGADRVIDYTKEDFTKGGPRYDVILDNVGNQPLLKIKRALVPKGKYVMIGGGGVSDQGVIGPMIRPIKALLLRPFVSQEMGMMMSDPSQNDYKMLADLMQAGKVTPVIDRTYPLAQIADAIRYLEQGHARGKVIITVGQDNPPPPTTSASTR